MAPCTHCKSLNAAGWLREGRRPGRGRGWQGEERKEGGAEGSGGRREERGGVQGWKDDVAEAAQMQVCVHFYEQD